MAINRRAVGTGIIPVFLTAAALFGGHSPAFAQAAAQCVAGKPVCNPPPVTAHSNSRATRHAAAPAQRVAAQGPQQVVVATPYIQPGFAKPLVYDLNGNIPMPTPTWKGEQILQPNEQKAIEEVSGCNRKGFFQALGSPFNPDCQFGYMEKQSVMTGTVGITGDGHQGFNAATVTMSTVAGVKAGTGTGWAPTIISGVVQAAGLPAAYRAADALAKAASNATAGAVGGGGPGCGTVIVNGSTVQDVSAACVSQSAVSGSAVGQRSTATGTGTTTGITYGYGSN